MVIDVSVFCDNHQMGERATHPIAHFFGRLALLLLLAWDGHAASSRLMKQLAVRLGCKKTTAKSLVIVKPRKNAHSDAFNYRF